MNLITNIQNVFWILKRSKYLKENEVRITFQNSQFLVTDVCEIEELEDLVIEAENPKFIYRVASFIVGSNVEKLQDAIIKIGDPEYILMFASSVKDADMHSLGNKIIEIGNPEYICKFAHRFFPNRYDVDSKIIEDALLKAGDKYWIKTFKELKERRLS